MIRRKIGRPSPLVFLDSTTSLAGGERELATHFIGEE